MTRAATSDGEARPRRSLKRLGYDLADADARGHFYMGARSPRWTRRPDLFGFNLAGVEQWIRDRVQAP